MNVRTLLRVSSVALVASAMAGCFETFETARRAYPILKENAQDVGPPLAQLATDCAGNAAPATIEASKAALTRAVTEAGWTEPAVRADGAATFFCGPAAAIVADDAPAG